MTLALATAMGAYAEADDVLGEWYTAGERSKVEIYKQDGKYFGKLVWLGEPTYPEGDPEAGKARHDRQNPDASKQNDPILGLVFMHNFEYDEGEWTGGKIYDPETGKTYKCKMTLADPNTLDVRGYMGIAAFGRTETWKRVPKEEEQKPEEAAAPAAAE
jgi:uncharacterized protein (DUF2147 family)